MLRPRKRQKTSSEVSENPDFFDRLPDDLVFSILSKLSSTASCPSDFMSILITCKRLNRLGLHPFVVSKAGPKVFAVKAKNWSKNAHRFLKYGCHVGNPEACYALGMIRFYCLHNQRSGSSLMARAAIQSHALALYSLAIIQFNGSGGTKNDKNLCSGVALCARAAVLGHNIALRELGHCLQDGYGVRKNIADGRRLLFQANARELAMSLRSLTNQQPNHDLNHDQVALPMQYLTGFSSGLGVGTGLGPACPLLSDYGCDVPQPKVHPVNQFLKDWFESGKGGVLAHELSFCSYSGCGRPEFRVREFRRCSVCGRVRYCSRGCQALDWKMRHRLECAPIEEIGDVNGVEEIEGNVDVAT